MPFTPICPQDAVREGELRVFRSGKRRVLLVWPKGGELKAFKGLCPHADFPMDAATFDGEAMICPRHKWRFDATSGKCLKKSRSDTFRAYEWRIASGEIQVKLGKKKKKKADKKATKSSGKKAAKKADKKARKKADKKAKKKAKF